jgi:hypothetical protein
MKFLTGYKADGVVLILIIVLWLLAASRTMAHVTQAVQPEDLQLEERGLIECAGLMLELALQTSAVLSRDFAVPVKVRNSTFPST